MLITLRISTGNGRVENVHIRPNATLGELRLAIWRKTGVPWSRKAKCQELTHRGIPVSRDDRIRINSIPMENGDVLQLVENKTCMIDQQTYLHEAAIEGERKLVRKMIEEGEYSVSSKDCLSRTPVHYAVFVENRGIVEDLIGVSEDGTSAFDNEGNTPSHYGIMGSGESLEKIMEALAFGGANLDSVNNNGLRPLNHSPNVQRVAQWVECGASTDDYAVNPLPNFFGDQSYQDEYMDTLFAVGV